MTVVAGPSFNPALKPVKKRREEDLEAVFAAAGFQLADFTPEEQKCISDKVSQVVGEGKPQDQAVAIAVSECAPGKSKAALRDDPARRRQVGGGYTAIDNGDGTFDLLDVEIFAELPEGAKRNKEEIGRDWMAAAVRKNRQREQEGYLPPTHVFHSDDVTAKPIYAGKLRLKTVGEIQYEGRKLSAIFADIVDIPGDVFGLIEKGQMPYRSVEVHDWDNPEIDSLALMPTDVPYFRMRNLTVGQIVKRGANRFRSESPAVWHRSVGEAGSLILFRFQEKLMGPEDEKDKDKAAAADEKRDEEQVKDADGVTRAEDNGDEEEKDEAKLEDGQTMPPWAAKMLEIMGAIAQRVGVAEQAPPEEPPESSDDLSPVSGFRDKGGKGKSKKPKESETMDEKKIESMIDKAALKATTPLVAKLSVLEKEAAEAKTEKKVAARMQKAEKELRGTNFDDNVRAHLLKAAKGEDDKGFDETIATFKKILPVEPAESLGEFEALIAKGSNGQEVQDEVAKFTAKHPGPKAAEWAKRQLKAYADYKGMSRCDMSAEEWLEVNIKSERPNFA